MPTRETVTGPEIESRAPRAVRRVLRRLFAVALAVAALAAGVFFALGGHEAYPLLYRRELNAVLGEGRWRLAGGETKSPYVMMEGDPESYRQWTIHYMGVDDRDYEFRLSNHTHRISKARRRIWDEHYVGKRLDFAMGMQDIIEEYAAQQVKDELVAGIFAAEDYQSALPTISDHGVGIYVAVHHVSSFTHDDYLRAVDPDQGYDLRRLDVGDMLAAGKQYIEVYIRTYAASASTVQDIDRKSEQLVDALLERYGEHATFELRVCHYDEGEDYHDLYGGRMRRYFAHNGRPLTTAQLETEHFDAYLKTREG